MLNNLKVSTRLYSLVVFMSVLLLAIGFLGLNSARNSNSGLDGVYKDRVVPLKDLKIIADMYAVNIVDTSHKLRNGGLQWADAERNVRDAQKTIAEKWKAYLATTLVPEEKKLVDEILPLMKAADAATDKLLNLIVKNDTAGVTAFTINELYPAIDPVSGKFTELVDVQLKVAKQEYDASSALYRRTMTISIAAILAGVLVAAALGVTIARSITRPLATGVDVADALANGDFTVDPEVTGSDETARLMGAMKNMAARLREVISQTVAISDGVASASTQLHATSDQIANGSEELAQQTGTVATASEEMAATSGDIARNCLMAAEASRRTSTSAREGATVVNATIEGMKRISQRVKSASSTVEALGSRSEEIGAIIGTIEDIADQTNLLALNAAIEAARAGEQGRGFAVVADEVRALAERTTKATGEISKMIKSIQNETREAVRSMEEGVREVEAGAASSQKSGEVLEAILDQINDVTEQINLIATAAEEQTATTGEITSNISQVAEVVHHTARGAEETSSAAGQLADQAQRLQTLMSHFRTV